MKTKILLSVLLVVVISSCTTPAYLPAHEKIDENQYGSYIEVYLKTGSYVNGELIAIDTNSIIVLQESGNAASKKIATVRIIDANRFLLRYAKPKNYGWTIPLYSLASISHGIFAIFTLPLNLLVTISVAVGGERAFTYNDRKMTYDKLRMFARFPQGIPPEIDMASIK
jgi:hypothetical protein